MLFPVCGKIKQRLEETLKVWNCHWVVPFLDREEISIRHGYEYSKSGELCRRFEGKVK